MPMSADLPEDALSFLREWLGETWGAEPLRGDASVRAYYRISAGDSRYMLAYYPESVREQLGRFLRAYDAISPTTPVPQVVRFCESSVAQADVGDATLFDLLHRDRDEAIVQYRRSIDLLVAFQSSAEAAGALNPKFDAELFNRELEMTLEFYAGRLMGTDVGSGVRDELKTLSDNLTRHPYVLCHRDFHGQNIHIINDHLYVIDYQDLRMGPDTYDLASLLRDRGAGDIIGRETELELLSYYRDQLGADEEIRSRYFETLLQRSLKILGTFAKQAVTRNRRHYLDFIPSTIRTIERCLEELPAFENLREGFPMTPADTER